MRAPTPASIRRILDGMEGIVAEFAALFACHTNECPAITDLHRELRARAERELERAASGGPLSPELTRLVLTFEDPQSPGEVRTLHGLKRYLHQRSLKLALRLAGGSGGTNRTVDLLVGSRTRILRRAKTLHYVEFDPGGPASPGLPYAVRMVVEGFGRSLLHGRESFPTVRIFCYGSEIHYFVSFGSHPALLRVSFAPPSQGGMLDLEFFGVSKYELTAHPNPSLDGLAVLFRRLDCDIRIDTTRVSVRYDKERALDLADLCEKAERLASALPYLMDLDWMLGDLALDAAARAEAARAWAEWFVDWGVLPFEQILTRDRRGVLLALESGPAGEREVLWDGEGRYRDRFSAALPRALPAGLAARLRDLGLDPGPLLEREGQPLGQLRLEQELLRPLRAALARGEIARAPGGFERRTSETSRTLHAAELFAEVLASRDDRLGAAAAVARVLEPVARALRFRTTGTVNGHDVQSAMLPLVGGTVWIGVLRDPSGIQQLGLFAHGPVLGCWRDAPGDPWQSNVRWDPAELAALLRRHGYLAPGAAPAPETTVEQADRIRERFRTFAGAPAGRPEEGDRVVTGLRASPGRAVGRALIGTAGRMPAEFDGAILVTAALRPEDNASLYHAAGVVSTGGGVLSHVGLVALQLRKPALIVPGEWDHASGGRPALRYRGLDYQEEESEVAGFRVTVRRNVREPEHRLEEGDLVVLDADAGTLEVLGQDRESLALHAELRSLAESVRSLAVAGDPAEVLALRGRKLRARHQLVRLLGGLTSPALARHAVRELLAGEDASREGDGRDERMLLLSTLIGNPRVGEAARGRLLRMAADLSERFGAACAGAAQEIPRLPSVYLVLASRFEVLRLNKALSDIVATLRAEGLEPPESPACAGWTDQLVRGRLEELRSEQGRALSASAAGAERRRPRLRHLLRHLGRVDEVLGTPERERAGVREASAELERSDEKTRARLSARWIVWPADGGHELHPLVGWKAANLAEAARLVGPAIPPWFAVTKRAFEDMLTSPLEGASADGAQGERAPLGSAIKGVLAARLGHAEQATRIRALWERAALPPALVEQVAAAYQRLARPAGPNRGPHAVDSQPFVSVRSSGCEEDAETAARAGEFDTFLFVRGEQEVVRHLKRAWSGLWSERAIHNRAVLGLEAGGAGGGVIVQRMVRARVSGVLVTCNVADGELSETVVNAGLGLGEGVVSGAVAADHVVIARGEDANGPLRFRYVTADKREQFVFDQRAEAGTMRAPTLYHQRLRPALEYVELAELARLAARLEAAYCQPLDLEFGIEGARLWLLQVRPVPVLVSAVRDTLEHHPLAVAAVAPGRAGGLS
ncbi:MAG TPA: PEP/pyruvate-binding domain-containing protein [Terriglobales bacterium]|nr:PEP/pyruvate-binding domain-containing protein [Terriglobales bacterium]